MKSNVKKLSVVALSALALTACSNSSQKREYYSATDLNPNLSVTDEEGQKVSFKNVSADEKKKILGLLEGYAVDNALTGISLFENGGYVMYSDTVELPTDTYVSGYGFGVLREGKITSDLAGENNQAWKRYYHTYETEDPGTLNYMDDKGSVVGGLIGYAGGSYFGNKLSSNGTSYEWIGDLAKQDRPTLLNADGSVASDQSATGTKFRFEVRVGDELVYSTKTKNSALSRFNGRKATIEDYVTPYKLKWTQKVGYARAAEGLTGSGSVKGSSAYYNASADGINDDAFENVGVRGYEENGKAYLEFELNEATTPFMAMYYLSSSMYAPVPMDFIEELGNGDVYAGAKAWGKKTDNGLSPVDTTLSTGAYVLSTWENDKQIVWDKNPNYNRGGYEIAGVHVAILKAVTTDAEAALKEFLANKLSSVGIPTTQLANYKNDRRTKQTTGDSVFKLNVNACDEKTWESLFGQNGSITQTAPSDYWQVEPALSNANFLKGLSYSINRKEFAEKRGSVASVNYLSSNYLIDPENGISWNSTEEHKQAVASLTNNGKVMDGYDLQTAKEFFTVAAQELIASGKYKTGDKITLEIAWQAQSQVTNYGADIKNYFESAFNSANTGLTLEVTNMAVAVWSDVYYKKMMVGQYDLGFGSISGNSYDPINFMEVLKSDNSSGFTLNWGTDTNTPAIVYNGKTYSYDALWQATDSSVLVTENGSAIKNSSLYAVGIDSSVHNEDDTRTIVLKTKLYQSKIVEVKLSSISGIAVIDGEEVNIDADKFKVTPNGDGTYTITVASDIETVAEYMYVEVSFSVDGATSTESLYIQVINE